MSDTSQVPDSVGSYQVIRELGRGGMSVVYRASRDGKDYALKMLLDSSSVDAIDLHVAFRKEAAAIARLRHPALTRIVEVGEAGGHPFMVMELAEGENLETRIGRAPLSEEEALAIVRVLADALVEVHRFGLVHRDIKPGNVVVDRQGQPRLIDFGLVSDSTEGDAVVGTLYYAAPEQIGVLKRTVGAPADLYALGATLFECLTGRPPITAETDSDFLQALATVPAPTLLSVRPETRPALSAIVARLLAKDPDERYQTARGLLADLADLDRLDEVARRGEPLTLGAQDIPIAGDQDVPLIGRKEEFKKLQAGWSRAKRGEISFAQVEGEGGSGKTRLAREIIHRATKEGALVLFGKCQELETMPFGPLREAADQYAARLVRMSDANRDAAVQQMVKAAGDLAPLVKRLSVGLARFLPDVGEVRALEPDAEQQRFYEAISSFFGNLGTAQTPVILVVDDIQWLDEGSLRVLGRLAAQGPGRKAAASPAEGDPSTEEAGRTHLLVLTTSRNNQVYQDALARFREALGSRKLERLELQALELPAIGELITARLGGRPLDAPTVEKLATLTRGNPFAVGEYLRSLLDAGVVRPSAQGWVADPVALDAVRLPKDVVELVVNRMFALGLETTRVVGMAGIIGGRFPLDLLTRVAELAPEVISRCIEELLRAGLVERSHGDTWAFVHDRVREAAIERLSDDQRRQIHQAVAQALESVQDPSAGHLYTLARHYLQGQVEKDPARVAHIALEAGLKALEDHANEEAHDLLDRALDISRTAGTYDTVAPRLLESLGRACAMTGRLDRAFEHLEAALALARDRKDRFRLEYLLTLTYASQGRNDEALATLYRAFEVLGRPFPRSLVMQLVTLLWFWGLALALRWLGVGHGSARGEDRERRQVLSQLHYVGSMLGLFQGSPFLMVQCIVRDYYNVHFLGASAETAIASAVYGTVLGLMQLRKTSARYTRLGIEMAEQLGDRAALAVCRAYEAAAIKWTGDLVRGNEMLVASLPDLHRYVPGSWYAAMMICEQAYSYLHGGLSGSAIDHVRTNLSQLERTNNKMFRWNTLSVMYAELMVTGETRSAQELWDKLEPQYKPMESTIYVGLAKVIARLEVLLDQEDMGAEADSLIELFKGLLSEDYYSHMGRVLTGYCRMVQFLQASPEARPQARRRFEQAIQALSLRAMVPIFSCHPPLWRAVLARVDGRYEQAWRLLRKADRLATRCNSRRALYQVALERARLARAQDDSSARAFALTALEVAQSESWKNKVQRVRAEFSLTLPSQATSTLGAPTEGRAEPVITMKGTVALQVERARRYADALLQVSLATASTLDLDTQARNALKEVTRVLGAERALFFLMDPASGALVLKASTGTGAEAVSQTVVRKVVETRAPLMLTGTDEGEALGSKSIVAHGLRSIIAAPVMLREQIIGVLYLDNRLARGMFSEEDKNLLLAVSNHIAISVETARIARVEAEKSAMQRDFELLGAVQSLLLPRASTFQSGALRGAGFFQAASQCGGDWWWHERLQDDSLVVALGDVTGHGAAPAMITSTVAGTFHTMRRVCPDVGPKEIAQQIDTQIRGFGGGFHMTMALLRFDPCTQKVSFWSAGAPAILILRKGRCESVTARGQVLGDPTSPFEVGEVCVPFEAGDRLLVFSDGLPELKRADGRNLGLRRVSQMFSRMSGVPVDQVPIRMRSELQELLGGRLQDDDITFVVVEATASPSPTASQAN